MPFKFAFAADAAAQFTGAACQGSRQCRAQPLMPLALPLPPPPTTTLRLLSLLQHSSQCVYCCPQPLTPLALLLPLLHAPPTPLFLPCAFLLTRRVLHAATACNAASCHGRCGGRTASQVFIQRLVIELSPGCPSCMYPPCPCPLPCLWSAHM